MFDVHCSPDGVNIFLDCYAGAHSVTLWGLRPCKTPTHSFVHNRSTMELMHMLLAAMTSIWGKLLTTAPLLLN